MDEIKAPRRPWNDPRLRWGVVGGVLAAAVVYVVWAARSGPILALRSPDVSLAGVDTRDIRALKVDSREVEFGEVPVDEIRVRRLEVLNTGARPVTVTSVVSSCPCVSGRMAESTIAPGRSAMLDLSFKGVSGRRSYATTLALVTDENGPSRYEIPVRGQVRSEFIVEPEVLNFGALPKGTTQVLTATVRLEGERAFSIREARPASPDFKVSWVPAAGGKNAFQVSVTALPVRAGRVSEEIPLLTEPSFKAPPVLVVSFEVQGDVVCEPSMVSTRATDGAGVALFEATLRHVSGTSVEIESVREGRGLPVEFTHEKSEGGKCLLRIRLMGKGQEPSLGELLIKTSAEAEPVHLPYRIEVPKSTVPGHP